MISHVVRVLNATGLHTLKQLTWQTLHCNVFCYQKRETRTQRGLWLEFLRTSKNHSRTPLFCSIMVFLLISWVTPPTPEPDDHCPWYSSFCHPGERTRWVRDSTCKTLFSLVDIGWTSRPIWWRGVRRTHWIHLFWRRSSRASTPVSQKTCTSLWPPLRWRLPHPLWWVLALLSSSIFFWENHGLCLGSTNSCPSQVTLGSSLPPG